MSSLNRLFGGRIGRGRFWLGTILLFIVFAAAGFLLIALGFGVTVSGTSTTQIAGQAARTSQFFETTLAPVPGSILAVLSALAFIPIAIKRRRDRANSGWDALAILGVSVVAQLLSFLHLDGPLSVLLSFVVLIGGIYLLVVCGFLKGTAGPNSYGPDPLQG